MSESGADEELDEIRKRKRRELEARLRGGDDGAGADGGEAATPPSESIRVDGAPELREAVEAYDVALVDFYADWCGPCKMLEPTVESLAASTDAAVATVDVDRNRELASEYRVQGVPTLLLFSGGEPVERVTGVRDESSLRSLIQRY